MNNFGTNDVVFARATRMGQEIVNLKLCGVKSFENLLEIIRRELGKIIGIVNVNIRNISQGWTRNCSYRVA